MAENNYNVLKGDMLLSAEMEIVFTKLLLLEEMKQNEKQGD